MTSLTTYNNDNNGHKVLVMKGEVSKPQAVEKAVFMYVTRTTCQCSLLSVHGGHRTLDPLLKFFNDISTNVSSP